MNRLDYNFGDAIVIASFFDSPKSTYLTLGLSSDETTIRFQEDDTLEEAEKIAEEFRRDGLEVVTWHRVA